MGNRLEIVRAALVGGPMYDPLYSAIPAFERETGLRVDIVARLPHPELNAFVAQSFAAGDADLDLISTHTKYAPSQAQWLMPLDGIVDSGDLLPRPAMLSRIDGRLLQVPRNLDLRLLHFRRDLIGSAPETWADLADVATRATQPGQYGFLCPGRDSGLFGTFYEMLVSAGGELFDEDLRPAFDSNAGLAAATLITELHHVRRVTPRALPSWHYDEISASFRAGQAAMVCDWPGSYHLYRNPATCDVWDRIGLAPLPAGSSGKRAIYGGCHSFAIAAPARNVDGGSGLLRFLTSFDAQVNEARQGAIPCRAEALARIRDESSADPVEKERWDLLAAAEGAMIVPPRFAAYPRCEDAIWQAVQRAMVGDCTPREAIAHAASAVQAIVNAPRRPVVAS
jgi:multiple sugar transport system substrate-binding protein